MIVFLNDEGWLNENALTIMSFYQGLMTAGGVRSFMKSQNAIF